LIPEEGVNKGGCFQKNGSQPGRANFLQLRRFKKWQNLYNLAKTALDIRVPLVDLVDRRFIEVAHEI
jgi:hypothetical protein